MTLKEQAWQSGLVLSDETAQWNETDWPPLDRGWRDDHASVVLDHPDNENKPNNNNNIEQTVVVMGGSQQGQGIVNSVLLLNLTESNKQWREGPPMNKRRSGHTAVVCSGGVYVIGGRSGSSSLACMERIDSKDILQSSITTNNANESHWTTLTCRLSSQRSGCCAVAVQDRYIVAMGGKNDEYYFSSVDIIDTKNHTVTAAPSMNAPRAFCASAVIGHRIFVVGGHDKYDSPASVECIDFAGPCDNEESKEDTAATATLISFSTTWSTHPNMVLWRTSCAMVAMGSCLLVAGGWGEKTVQVLDTHRNRVWNFPLAENERNGCSLVTVAKQIAVISGWRNPTCKTIPLMDKHTWCFRRLCQQPRNEWYHFQEGMVIRDVNVSSCAILSSNLKRVRRHGGIREEDCT